MRHVLASITVLLLTCCSGCVFLSKHTDSGEYFVRLGNEFAIGHRTATTNSTSTVTVEMRSAEAVGGVAESASDESPDG